MPGGSVTKIGRNGQFFDKHKTRLSVTPSKYLRAQLSRTLSKSDFKQSVRLLESEHSLIYFTTGGLPPISSSRRRAP
jgi:hypothetical protein